MNYVDDIAATLCAAFASCISSMNPEERKRLAEGPLRGASANLNGILAQLERKAVVAQVNTIAVIGAGTMGRGIAHVAALGGYRTILEDLLPTPCAKQRPKSVATSTRPSNWER